MVLGVLKTAAENISGSFFSYMFGCSYLLVFSMKMSQVIIFVPFGAEKTHNKLALLHSLTLLVLCGISSGSSLFEKVPV